MKRLLTIIAVLGTLAVSSCTKHACPAYGSSQKAVQPVLSQRV